MLAVPPFDVQQLTYDLSSLRVAEPPTGILPLSEVSVQPAMNNKNTTETVSVPTSEHVAEIVGRQGCKIKALRATTNTYIKTPVRGEEPIFIITGRCEDVMAAVASIKHASEHFSQIRASRRGAAGLTPPQPGDPGQVTIHVRVPYRVVGLVVGPKGATIKRVQQNSHTYIVTPSRDKEPVFEITGLLENVERARLDIQQHIAARTGGLLADQSLAACLDESAAPPCGPCPSVANFMPPPQHHHLPMPLTGPFDDLQAFQHGRSVVPPPQDPFPLPAVTSALLSSLNLNSDSDEGIDSPLLNLSPLLGTKSIWSDPDDFPGKPRSNSLSSSRDSLSPISDGPFGASTFPDLSAVFNAAPGGSKLCKVCTMRERNAALVPCGHNLFCYDCALRVAESEAHKCPQCKEDVAYAFRILLA